MENSLQTPFNSTQVEILKLFSQGLTDSQLEELRKTLIDFRFKLLDEHIEKVVKDKGLSKKQIDKLSKEHRRTSSGNQSEGIEDQQL